MLRVPPDAVRRPFALVIPTLEAEADLEALLPALARQTRQPDRFVVVDSSSTDSTRTLAEAAGAEVHIIERRAFDHGGTRTRALERVGGVEFVLYMTQDACPADDGAFEALLGAFEDPDVAVAYGRQLPKPGAGPIEVHARAFNYPARSEVRDLAFARRRGFKACFCSNSFAAWRLDELRGIGGFSDAVIFGEDSLAAMALILAGRKSAYVAEARVHHSHAYTLGQEFRRYFDIGVMHASAEELIRRFGEPTGEGVRYIVGEIRHLARRHALAIPECLLRAVLKFTSYRLGRHHRRLPLGLKRSLSLNAAFWRDPATRETN